MAEEKRYDRCFWCGNLKDKSIEETEETLKNTVISSYVPCDDCKKVFAEGIHVIGVTSEPIVEGMFPISKNGDECLYPTGSMFVANEEFVRDLLSDSEDKALLDDVLKEKILMLKDEVVVAFIEEARKAQQGEDLEINPEIAKKIEEDEENV